jgi:hypothetical protein
MNFEDALKKITAQYYSPSTQETLTIMEEGFGGPSIEAQVEWVAAHKDAVLIYTRRPG